MAEEEKPREKDKEAVNYTIAGLSIYALFATGIIGVFHAILSGHGEGLIASAIAFGVAAHVSLGK